MAHPHDYRPTMEEQDQRSRDLLRAPTERPTRQEFTTTVAQLEQMLRTGMMTQTERQAVTQVTAWLKEQR